MVYFQKLNKFRKKNLNSTAKKQLTQLSSELQGTQTTVALLITIHTLVIC